MAPDGSAALPGRAQQPQQQRFHPQLQEVQALQEASPLESDELRHSHADGEAHSSQVEADCLEGWRLARAQAYQVELEEQCEE